MKTLSSCYTCLLFVMCIVARTDSAYAGAWTMPEGAQQEIYTYRYYGTDTFFDESGEERDKSGTYSKHEIEYYSLYGLSDALTFGVSTITSHQEDTQDVLVQDPVTQESFLDRQDIVLQGITATDVFLRYQLYRDDAYAFAIQPAITLPPLFTRGRQNAPAKGAFEFEIALSGGHAFEAYGQQHYAQLTGLYRQRTGDLGNQYEVAATLGMQLSPRWSLLIDGQHTEPTREINSRMTTITGRNDYELTKLQLSALYQLSDSINVQAGWFEHVRGKNTGAGGGGVVSLWFQL